MKTTTDNKDTYQRITDYVIDQLAKGEIVWQKNWNSLGLPKNVITNHSYKGWNVFFLNFVTSLHGYKTPYFITYKQALDKGGTICRGQKGYQVVWWATIEDKNHPIKNENREENTPLTASQGVTPYLISIRHMESNFRKWKSYFVHTR